MPSAKMYNLGFLLLLSSICLSSQSQGKDDARKLTKTPILSRSNSQHTIAKKNENDCLCLPQQKLFETLAKSHVSEKFGINRLVIYLYKDNKSGAIRTYIPSSEKQKLILDLPYDNKDVVYLNNYDPAKHVLNVSPQVAVNEEKNQPSLISKQKQSDVAKPGKKLLPLHNDNSKTQNRWTEYTDYKKPNMPYETITFDTPPVLNNNEGFDHTTRPLKPQIVVASATISPTFSSGNITGNKYIPAWRVPPSNPNVQILNADYLEKKLDPEVDIKPQTHNAQYDNEIDVTFTKWFNTEIERMNVDKPEKSLAFDNSTLKFLIEESLHKNGFYVSEKGILIDSSGSRLNMANLILRPILIGNSVAYENLLTDDKENSKFTIPNKWPYLEAIFITLKNPSKILGIIPIGVTYIPKNISEKRINIKSDGSSDKIQKPYMRVEKRYPNSRYNDFLDDPDSSISNEAWNNNHEKRQQLNRIRNKNEKLRVKFYNKKNKPETKNSTPSGIINIDWLKALPLLIRKNSQQSKLSEVESDFEYSPNYESELPSKNPFSEKWTKRKSLFNKLTNSNRNNRLQFNQINQILEKIYRTHNKDDDGLNEMEDYTGDLAFRIIGGGAATGSGAPLSNKGRTGHIDDNMIPKTPIQNSTSDQQVSTESKLYTPRQL